MGSDSDRLVHHEPLPPASNSSRGSPGCLPSFAELASNLSESSFVPAGHMSQSWQASVSQAPGKRPVSRSTPPNGPGPNPSEGIPTKKARPSSWTAINDHMQISSSAPSPSNSRQENGNRRLAAQELEFHQYSAPILTAPHPPSMTSELGQIPHEKQPTSKRPIGASRQDSATSESRGFVQPSTVPVPVKSSPEAIPIPLASIPESTHLCAGVGNGDIHRTTPPSPAPSPIQNPALKNDNQRNHANYALPRPDNPTELPSILRNDQRKTAGSLHPRPKIKAEPLSSMGDMLGTEYIASEYYPVSDALASSPRQSRSVRFTEQSYSVANPPRPTSSHDLSISNITNAIDTDFPPQQTSTLSLNSKPTHPLASAQAPPPNPFAGQSLDLSSPRGESSRQSSQSSGASDVSASLASARERGHPRPRCARCNNVWSSPPPPDFPPPEGPSKTFDAYNQGTIELVTKMRNYRERVEGDYAKWLEHHGFDKAVARCTLPGSDSQENAIQSSKRKSEILSDDNRNTSKLRRGNMESPSPKLCQTTPPPEPSSSSLPPDPSTPYRLPSHMSSEPYYISNQVAAILQMPGVEPHPHERPPENEYNMWRAPDREKKSNNKEQTQRRRIPNLVVGKSNTQEQE